MAESRYAQSFVSPNGPGDARPTALQIIQDESLTNQYTNRTCLVTGASSGIGVETARALSATGAKVFVTARDVPKAKQLMNEISSSIEVLECELDSLDSVRACATAFLAKSNELNILVLNAGIMACPESKTKDGFEAQFGTNYLGHFLLFQLLRDTMLESSKPGATSRVISVSSSGHRMGKIHFGNFNFDNDPSDQYEQWAAYGQSKTGNIYLANEIERRYGSQGLHAWSLHPGSIFTGLQKHVPERMTLVKSNEAYMKQIKSTEQGAATSVWGAVARELEGKGGKYLDNVQVATQYDPTQPPWAPGYVTHAYDEAAATRLWDETFPLVLLTA